MDPVSAAFSALPREHFLRRHHRHQARYDGPLAIGNGQTNSQPRTVAAMLRLLAACPGQRVLDVGSGSAWTTALLAHLVGPTGSVIGVELEPDLVKWGAANLAKTDQPWASILQATPDVLGAPDRAPFDRILVSAEPAELPGTLVEQLRDGGRLVIPVAGTMLLVIRSGDEVSVTEHGHYRFVPLR
jgi:protein-L-isoaspartate(D-aspartate) O-methyltransferase